MKLTPFVSNQGRVCCREASSQSRRNAGAVGFVRLDVLRCTSVEPRSSVRFGMRLTLLITREGKSWREGEEETNTCGPTHGSVEALFVRPTASSA